MLCASQAREGHLFFLPLLFSLPNFLFSFKSREMDPGAFPDPPTKTLRVTSFIYSMILLQNCNFIFTNTALQTHYKHISRPVKRLLLFILTLLQVRISRTDWMQRKKHKYPLPLSGQLTLCNLPKRTQLVFTHSTFHTWQFFVCECERCRVKLDPDAWGVVFQPGGLCTDSHVNMRSCRKRSEKGDTAFKKNIFIILHACVAEANVSWDKAKAVRAVRSDIIYSLSGFGLALLLDGVTAGNTGLRLFWLQSACTSGKLQ